MKHSAKSIQSEELRSLDLQQCHSVGDIVDAMRYCAFGGRMLGEVAATMRDMAAADTKPLLIYDGIENSPLSRLLRKFVANGWGPRLIQTAAFVRQKKTGDKIIFVRAVS